MIDLNDGYGFKTELHCHLQSEDPRQNLEVLVDDEGINKTQPSQDSFQFAFLGPVMRPEKLLGLHQQRDRHLLDRGMLEF